MNKLKYNLVEDSIYSPPIYQLRLSPDLIWI